MAGNDLNKQKVAAQVSNKLNIPVNVYLEINGKPRRGAGPVTSPGSHRSQLNPKKQMPLMIGNSVKDFKLIYVLEDIPVSDQGVKGIKVIPGENLIAPHHFELKFRADGKYEAILHFKKPAEVKKADWNLLRDLDPAIVHPEDG